MIHFFWQSAYLSARWTAPRAGGQLCANSEICWHLAEGLRARFGAGALRFHNMGTADVGAGPDDVLVGHIGPWANHALARGLTHVVPMLAWPSELKWPYDQFVYHDAHRAVLDRVPTFIALCGEWAWQRSASDNTLVRWRNKAVQVPLGFSRDLFPQVKHAFNPPGRRGFLYVGQVAEQKGVGYLCSLLGNGDSPFLIGNGEWSTGPRQKNIEVLGWLDNADQALWQALAERCDFFVCATQWDCQPVGPLENISRGFVPMLTPANCYPVSIPLTGDAKTDLRTIDYWQKAPESELCAMQAQALTGLAQLPWQRTIDVVVKLIEANL